MSGDLTSAEAVFFCGWLRDLYKRTRRSKHDEDSEAFERAFTHWVYVQQRRRDLIAEWLADPAEAPWYGRKKPVI